MASKKSRNSKDMKKVADDQKPNGKVATITEENLSPLVPVIADLMSAIANKVNSHLIHARNGKLSEELFAERPFISLEKRLPNQASLVVLDGNTFGVFTGVPAAA